MDTRRTYQGKQMDLRKEGGNSKNKVLEVIER